MNRLPLLRHFLYGLLGICCMVLILSACTQPPRYTLKTVGIRDNIILVMSGHVNSSSNDQFWSSYDGGGTWQESEETAALPVAQSACVPQEPLHCFRLVPPQWRVEVSNDGGATWQISWQHTRRDYVNRTNPSDTSQGRNTDNIFQSLLYALVFTPETYPPPSNLVIWQGEVAYRVIVGLGEEGLLAYEPDQGWHDLESTPYELHPKPTYAANIEEAISAISLEFVVVTFFWEGTALLVVFGNTPRSTWLRRSLWLIGLWAPPIIIGLIFLMPQSGWTWISLPSLFQLLRPIVPIIALFMLAYSFFWGMPFFIVVSIWLLGNGHKSQAYSLLGGWLFGLVPLYAWAFAWLPWQWVASLLVLILTIGFWGLLLHKLRLSKKQITR